MNMLLNMVKGIFLSRAGNVALGLIAILTLVWFAGPYVGLKDVYVRLYIIIAIVAAFLIYLIVSWYITRRRAASFSKDLAKQGASDGNAAEIAALREKMDEALVTLKTSDLGLKYRGRAALYALPWYMIIGPSAAGKSTLLRNSGLHFPYSHTDANADVKGFGGTRNCDWWFSDEAVILDTAGRYTTEEADHDEWVQFLAMLKKHRRKMPINGIIVAISIADLLTADETGLAMHVKVVRDRINELITHLGFVFPLYIVFTKCDLLNGFQSFFSDLNDLGRSQVWGTYLELKPGEAPGEVVERKFEELYMRLCEWRIRKLHLHRKLQTKAQIYDFPAQYQAAAMRLSEFINLLFKDNPYQETPNFKGVYFTSGAQEGMPLQRVIGNLRQAFGYAENKEAADGANKSYFIKFLLKDVIFKAPFDILMSRRTQLFNRWVKTGAIFGGIILSILTVAIYSTAFTQNTLLLKNGRDSVEAVVTTLASDRNNPGEAYLAMARLYDHYVQLKKYEEDRPWYFSLGVYAGDEQLKPTEKMLIKSLERNILIPVGRTLENRLKDYTQRWAATTNETELSKLHSDYYDTLKIYLMLSTPSRMSDEEALPILMATWKSIITPGNVQPSKELKAALDSHSEILMNKYLTHMRLPASQEFAAAHWQLNRFAVQDARLQLRTPPNADTIYTQVVRRSEAKLQPVALNKILKSQGSSYLESDKMLPGIFTRAGWEDYASREFRTAVNMASQGDWVLGTDNFSATSADTSQDQQTIAVGSNPSLARELEQQLRDRYFADYVSYWYDFLYGIKVQPDRSITDSANKLLTFSRNEGPVAELFGVIDSNINLQEVNWKQDSKNPRVYHKNVIADSRVNELTRPFADLRRFSTPADKSTLSEPVTRYLAALTTLQGDMEQFRNTSEKGRLAEQMVSGILSGKSNNSPVFQAWSTTTSILTGSETRTRQFIEPILTAPIKDNWRVMLGSATGEVQSKWNSMVVVEYDKRIRGRFPFTDSGPDATLEDVTEFFHPQNGILWTFVNNHLQSYIYKNNGVWTERAWMGMSPGFNGHLIKSLNESETITQGLFRRGSDVPDVTFQLQPIPAPGLKEFTLESNGQVYRYRMEPEAWHQFKWPGAQERTGARITAISQTSDAQMQQESQGVWGLFHLFRKAEITKQSGAQYKSTWRLNNNNQPHNVSFLVKADRENNLLQTGVFLNYSLPKQIFGGSTARNNRG